MTVAPHSGIVDFGTFTPPNAPADGIQGEVPAPLVGQENYVLTATGWAPGGGGGGSVTGVTASSPLGSSGGVTPNISFSGATGTAGQYLQSNGTASPVWSAISSSIGSTAYSGAFSDYTTQTIASTTTAYVMTLNTTDLSNGVSVVSGSRVTFANAGTYNFQWSGQFQNTDSQEQDVFVWIRINGTDVTGSTGRVSIPAKHGTINGHTLAGWNFYLTFNAGDYIELVWSATSTTVTLQTYGVGSSPTSPSTASLVVTVGQLTQIGIGYSGLTSTTSTTIGTGSKTFTTNLNATNTAFIVGTRIRISYTATPSSFMEGVITSFSGTTLVVDVDSTGGSGTYSSWNISVAGIQGNSGLTVGTTATSGGAAGQIMFDTGSVLQESSNLVWDNTNNVLRLVGATKTGVTLSGVQITGTAGQFSCSAASVPLVVGQLVTISGTFGGTGSITGYVNPTNYYISATNGSTTFTLVSTSNNTAIVTTAGTPTGLTYSYDPYPLENMTQTWNNSTTAFTGLKLNVTDTASNASSLLMDLQVGGSSRFQVLKSGTIQFGLAANASQLVSQNNTTIMFNAAGSNRVQLSVGVKVGSIGSFSFASTADANNSSDTIISRRAAANLQLGAADAAAPVAQTLSVQSVVAGTSNTAGANLTITGSQGTGTGAGGSIIFQVAPAGSTGTAQNALSTALTIAGTGISTFNFSARSSSDFTAMSSTNGATTLSDHIYLRDISRIRWMSGASTLSGGTDLEIGRRAAANLRFGAADAAAPVAQTLSVQSVVAGTTNTAGANLTITGSQGTGTGAGGSIIFQVAPAGSSGTAQNALATALTIGPTNIVTVAANLVVGSPSSDISANLWGIVNSSSSTSGRIIASEFKGADSSTSGGVFLVAQNSSSAVTSGARLGIFSFAGKNAANSLPSAAQLRAFATENWGSPNYGSRFELATTANGSINTTTRLIIGNSGIITFGATEANTVPALKPSSTTLQVRLGDDSGDAPLSASAGTFTSTAANTSLIAGSSYSLTGTSAVSMVDLAGTWNTTGTPTLIKANVTDTASNAASLLLDLQVGGVSSAYILKSGTSFFGAIRTSPLYGYASSSAARSDTTASRNLAFDGTNLRLRTGGDFGFTSGDAAGAADTFITRRGAANLRFGAADAAAPVAQTLSVQSVVAGTSNTAGANLTITGSQGTGAGAGGSIIFQVAPAGSSGTAQNALSTALTINSSQQLVIQSGSAVATSIAFSDSLGTGIWSVGTGNISFSTSGTERFRMGSGGRFAAADGVGFGQSTSVPFSVMTSSAYGLVNFSSGSGTTVRLNIGGVTSSFPSIKNSSTILQVRLADDSAYAPVEASTVRTATAYTVATLPAAGTAGRMAYVTDATAPTYLGALTGGGTVVCPVFDNGTAWVSC